MHQTPTNFMPVTKTAKRALRSSDKKLAVNKLIIQKLEISLKEAKRKKVPESIRKAVSQIDRAAKKRVIHKNKAARLKNGLSKLLPTTKKVQPRVKTSKKRKSSK